MMNYLIEVTICWLLFYGLYVSFLKQETFFSLNRFYLLGTFFGGLIIPILEIAPGNNLAQQIQQTILLEEIAINSNGAAIDNASMINEVNPAIDWSLVFYLFYGSILLLMAFRMLKGLLQIYRLKKQGSIIPETGYTRIETIKSHAPFSFFNYLFLSKENGLSTTEQHQVIAHELAHIKGRHSIDVLLMELVTVFLWFHPLIFLYKRSIKENHEYLADKAVLQFSSKKQYGTLLLEQAIPGLRLANNFNHSLLKKRIKMMSTNKSNNMNLLKYSICIPLLAIALILFSCKKEMVSQMNATDLTPRDRSMMSKSISENQEAKKELIEALKKGENGQTMKQNAKPIALFEKKMNEDGPMKDDDGTYTLVDEMARFPGCESESMTTKERKNCAESALLEFIYKQISYPDDAKTKGIEGLVFAKFDIDTEGNVSDHIVARGIGGGCDEEVLRAIKKMPKWIPAKHEGQLVKVRYMLPIRFKLN